LTMNYEKTLIIVKPDALVKKIVGRVISQFEEEGLRIMAVKMVWLNRNLAEEFYVEHKGKEFYEPLVEFIISNPVIGMVWGGEDAINRARRIIGATDPARADEGSVRKKWAANNRHNIVHGSDSPESAQREIGIFFPDENEIYKWQDREYKL